MGSVVCRDTAGRSSNAARLKSDDGSFPPLEVLTKSPPAVVETGAVSGVRTGAGSRGGGVSSRSRSARATCTGVSCAIQMPSQAVAKAAIQRPGTRRVGSAKTPTRVVIPEPEAWQRRSVDSVL